MSVDAAEADYLDEPLPHSPLRNRLSEALPKAPVGLQWKVDSNLDEVTVTLQTREGKWHGSKSVKVLTSAEDSLLRLIANTAGELAGDHERRRILNELSGAYEGSTE